MFRNCSDERNKEDSSDPCDATSSSQSAAGGHLFKPTTRRGPNSTFFSCGASLIFLRDLSTPSLLIEKGLQRAGHCIHAVEHTDDLVAEALSGEYDLVIMDNSLPIDERLSALKSFRKHHLQLPVIMVFGTNAEHEVAIATTESVDRCVVRDRDGAYLFKIQDMVHDLLTRDNGTDRAPRTTHGVQLDEITQQIDLLEIASKVQGAVAGSRNAGFVILAGPEAGTVVQIDGDIMLIGRDPTCDMSLKDDSISRFHASVKQHSSGVVTIRDLKSTNGTFIEGRRIQIEELAEGDKVLLGKNTVVRFQTQDSIDKSYYDELYSSATRDELTGLYNRRFFMEQVRTGTSFARRHSLPISIILFDVDHFKRVNDTYGHLTGDVVLAAISGAVRRILRDEDVLGRYGGEEFIIFAQNTDLQGAMVLAERVRGCVAGLEVPSHDGSGPIIRSTISIGVASGGPGECHDIERLISLADEKMYEAKNDGRNCVRGRGK